MPVGHHDLSDYNGSEMVGIWRDFAKFTDFPIARASLEDFDLKRRETSCIKKLEALGLRSLPGWPEEFFWVGSVTAWVLEVFRVLCLGRR